MPKSPSLYRLDIVPLTPLYGGRRDPRFSYAATEPVANGSLVSISFGRRMITGVVVSSAPFPGPVPDWMKFVGPTLLPGFLVPEQIARAERLADELYAPLGSVLKLFFPITRKPRATTPPDASGATTRSKMKSARMKRKQHRITPVLWEALPHDDEIMNRLITLGTAAMQAHRLLVILVPEIVAAELYAEKIQTALPTASIATLTSHRTTKEHYVVFEAIRHNTLNIVVGTRQTVFAPFGAVYAVVVIDAEKQLSYTQWEMMPRYDAIMIAENIAHERHIPFIRLSTAPGIEFFLPETKTTGVPFNFDARYSLTPIDLRHGSRRGRASQPLSPKIIECLQREVVSLILVKQRGMARFSICAKCQTPVRCPNCHAALSEAKEGHFRCLACGYRSAFFLACAACGHMHFKRFGAGTEKIARDLKRLGIGGHIVTLDRDTQSRKADVQSLITALAHPASHTTIIATYESAYSLPLPPLHLIAMIEADQGLFYPDFQSEERLWRELRRFGAKLAANGTLFVQTFEPEAERWTTGPLALTALSLLEERKHFHYPPYYRLIRLECYPRKDTSSLQVATQAESLLKTLKLPTIEILPKYLPFGRKNRYHILIRLPRALPIPKTLHHALHSFDPTIHITHNPPSLHG